MADRGAFHKAVTRIEVLAAHGGGYPDEVVLTRYPSRAAFDLHKPGESYAEHLIERARLVEYLLAREIRVIDDDVTAAVPTRGSALAETAERRHFKLKKGAPYRLGMTIGTNMRAGSVSYSALGWMTLALGIQEKGDE